ncbi:MAG: hypothetical protein RSC04_05145, partial [Bacteroidales bacterium]
INTSTTNHEYLATIRKVEQQQIYMQTKGLSTYYLLLSFGFAFYFYEFACGLSAYHLGVNPFDQPGVEAYKKNMFRLLGK